MYKALCPGAIGIRAASIEEAVAAARIGGFEGVEFSPDEAADRTERDGAQQVARLFSDAKIRPAGFGLPVEFRGEEAKWRGDLGKLPRRAKAAAAIGCQRCATWIMPCSDERPLEDNRRFHIERLSPVAKILADHGIALGLEFIGPKTLRESRRYPFIHTLHGMLAMAGEIGPGVGLLLDGYHWYTAGHTLDDLRRLQAKQVVYVHVNDAPAGVAVDEQLDDVRRLPGETGVIDIAGFLGALRGIGYDGPVVPEPFKKELADLPDDAARLRAAGAAMDKVWRSAEMIDRK